MNWVFWALVLIFVFGIWISLVCIYKNLGKLIYHKYDDIHSTFKEEKAVYIVRERDTLTEIAKKNKVTVGDIVRANPTIEDPDAIKVGDVIFIPESKALK